MGEIPQGTCQLDYLDKLDGCMSAPISHNDLLPDILVLVLSHVDVESLVRCSSCRDSWRSCCLEHHQPWRAAYFSCNLFPGGSRDMSSCSADPAHWRCKAKFSWRLSQGTVAVVQKHHKSPTATS